MRFVGLDVHQRSTSMCILNQNGKVVKESRVRGHIGKSAPLPLEKIRFPPLPA